MPSPRKVKGFSKKAVKQLNKNRGTAVSKRFGATVQTDVGGGRTIGYENTGETKLPKRRKKKASTPEGRKANRRARRVKY